MSSKQACDIETASGRLFSDVIQVIDISGRKVRSKSTGVTTYGESRLRPKSAQKGMGPFLSKRSKDGFDKNSWRTGSCARCMKAGMHVHSSRNILADLTQADDAVRYIHRKTNLLVHAYLSTRRDKRKYSSEAC